MSRHTFLFLCLFPSWGPFSVLGHLEDYCVYGHDSAATSGLQNFFHDASSEGCKYGSYRPECIKSVVKVAAHTFNATSPCRGAVHFDAVYIVASAVGILSEYAYWLAAFSQAIDFVQYAAVDSCGRDMGISWWTPPLRGLMRTSAATGGSLRHLGMPYGETETNGLQPNITDFVTEGMLAGYRQWARGERDLLCTNGLTEEVAGIPFGGSKCATGRWMTPHANPIIQGPIPANYTPYRLGEQAIDYTCGHDCNELLDITYAHDLEAHLNRSSAAKMPDGSPVPAVIARMGTYMHMLADRTSHYWCTDSAKSAYFADPTQPGNFTSKLDLVRCNAVTHAMQHYWEQGVERPLADQTWAALQLYYDELLAFRAMEGTGLFFNQSFVPMSQAALLGNKDTPGMLPIEIMKRNVTARVGGMHRLIARQGFDPVPGFESDCAGDPW